MMDSKPTPEVFLFDVMLILHSSSVLVCTVFLFPVLGVVDHP